MALFRHFRHFFERFWISDTATININQPPKPIKHNLMKCKYCDNNDNSTKYELPIVCAVNHQENHADSTHFHEQSCVSEEPHVKVKTAVEQIEGKIRNNSSVLVNKLPPTSVNPIGSNATDSCPENNSNPNLNSKQPNDDVLLRPSVLNRTRYQSVLVTDVPFYQDYNDNALNQDILRSITGSKGQNNAKRKTNQPINPCMSDLQEYEIAEENPSTTTSDHAVPTTTITVVEEPKPPIETPPPTTIGIVDIVGGVGPGGVRWADMPQVIGLGVLETMTQEEIKRQEALFEVITSEASYYRSLTVLIEGYINSPKFKEKMPVAHDSRTLFSNIDEIYETSEKFLLEMEKRWLNNPLLDDLCDIVRDFAHLHFKCFITYVGNQHYQYEKLNHLTQNESFVQVLRQLQHESQCPALTLNSFLLLPMQRICRLQLLVRTVIQRTPTDSPTITIALQALGALDKILYECDRKKKNMHHHQRIMEWSLKLNFRENVKTVSLGDQSRQLQKIGDLYVQDSIRASSAFKRSFLQKSLPVATLILLNDLVLFTKLKKGNNNNGNNVQYTVEEALSRTDLHCHCGSSSWKTSDHLLKVSHHGYTNDPDTMDDPVTPPYLLHLTTKDNESEYYLQTKTFSDMQRWIDAFNDICHRLKSFDELVEEDICQAVVKKAYLAKEDDELDLKDAERIVLLLNEVDGWSKGVTRDNRRGWFPSSHVSIILNDQEKTNHSELTNAAKAYQDWCQMLAAEQQAADSTPN